MDQELLRKNFENHGFATRFFATGAEASDYLAAQFTGRAIGFGGSKTLRQIGLYEKLAVKNAVVWHHQPPGDEIRRLASATRIYFTSVNAVSMTGEIVNIDGVGNRIAMSMYGPEAVYYIVGRNKIVPDLAAAMHRARNVAGPQNAQRIGVKTPCAVKADKCYDCNSPERICRATVILDRCPTGMPSEIVFIDEDLGM
ncbi:MAG: lactate utilization protein [Planctomycetaceae bacterium]|nr:lactate utilization protein [Planctomycetaceae bacterium]